MKITRIRLEQFKQFRKPVEITGLTDGINLFTGPNEAGKSTIVAAVRAAFFERHRSGSVDDLRPWGDASASPTVELDFTVGGQPYRLTKSFLGKKRCELQAGPQRLDGASAEDHLAELLGFQYAGKGASAAQHWGIPGLLWIQQGAGQDIHDPVAHATDHLRNALNASLGEVASSGGDDVLATVEAQRNELLTPAGGAPRGALSEALKRQSQLDAELKAADTDVATYRHKVDLLGGLRREHAADEAERPWAGFRRQEHEARGKLETIERVQTALASDRQRAEHLDAQVDALRAEALAQTARANEVEAALGKIPVAQDTADAPPQSVSEAETAEDGARRALEQINASLGPARIAAGNAQTTLEAAQREHQAAQFLLNAPDRADKLQAASQALVDARAEQSALAASVKTKADEVAQARPDILKQDVDRFQRSAEQLEKSFEERKTALLRLEVELESAGAQGLEERRAALARDLAQAARRAEELRRSAAALDHLLKLLKDQRGALTRKLQAPLQKHLNHYLQLLFPQAHLAIDETLSPGPLTRSGPAGPESGAFDALSFGAREQMGVISRLAYADLLREAGRPTLIILDDALVHSDEDRLALMKRILFDAATRHQILLFTCHPTNWRDIGVTPRSMDAVRAIFE